MKKLLKSKRGDGYIGAAVEVLITVMLILMIVNIFSFLTLKQDMDYFTKEMIEAACAEGKTNGETTIRYHELAEETGIHPSYSWTADYYNTADKTVQLGDTIKITMHYTADIKGFGLFKIPVTLMASHSGLSQKYRK